MGCLSLAALELTGIFKTAVDPSLGPVFEDALVLLTWFLLVIGVENKVESGEFILELGSSSSM